MCNPALAAAGMFATSAASQYGQYQAAQAQASMQNAIYDRNRQNAFRALAQEYGDISYRQSQEQQAAAEHKEEIARAERAQRASAIVRAGEAGITGLTPGMILRDISGAASRDRSTVSRNLEWTLGQLQRSKASAQTNTINQINSMQRGQSPSRLALGIGVANSAANSYMQYQSVKPQA